MCVHRQYATDLVSTDLVMPNMDGVEVCRRVKALSPETDVVFVSGHPREIEKHHMNFLKEGGRDEFLRKPIFENEILEVTKKIFKERRGLS